MKTVCKTNECTGCRACMNICARNAIDLTDTMKSLNAVIDEKLCVNCGRCTDVCPNLSDAEKRTQISWWQGWSNDESIRNSGSSGGVATSIMTNFIRDGGMVCSCLFYDGDFVFRCTSNLDEVKKFSGSKYVKSNPANVYREIKSLLSDGKKCLFIGLPCQVAALLKYVPEKLQARLYTIDLICHGTPSLKLFELYLKQNGVNISELENVRFRENTAMGLRLNEKALAYPGTVDRWLISFLKAINYTDNCYHCRYSTVERVSDITLGDSWGTSMTGEIPKGVSLIMVQTEKGNDLLEIAKLSLHEVDKENAVQHNGQLQHPSIAPLGRDSFFERLFGGETYNKLVMSFFPKQCLRQCIKGVAIRLKLMKPRSVGNVD